MVKDISFLKTGYGELIDSIRMFDKEIAEQKKKVTELESSRNAEARKLKVKIKEELFRAIEDDGVRSFLALPVYWTSDEGAEMERKGDILGNLHELYVNEKEVRVGDIWGFTEYRFMYVKIDDIKALRLKPTQKGLGLIFTKVRFLSDGDMVIEISDTGTNREKQGYILLKGYNRFMGQIAIE